VRSRAPTKQVGLFQPTARRCSLAEQADPKALDSLIRKGEVDTVLTVFPDGMGRLMGKRGSAGTSSTTCWRTASNACIYLFTVDMEMEPLPGFTLTSWERGYGDMKMVPDLGDVAAPALAPQDGPRLLRRLHREGKPIEEAPRWVLKRQLARASGAASP